MALSEEARARLAPQAAEIIGRYPRTRSALLPLLHLVQSEEGYVSKDGIGFCAEQLGLSEADVTGVVSFYTMYKRKPVGEYHVGDHAALAHHRDRLQVRKGRIPEVHPVGTRAAIAYRVAAQLAPR